MGMGLFYIRNYNWYVDPTDLYYLKVPINILEEEEMIADDIMDFLKGIVDIIYKAIEWAWNWKR